MRGLIYSTAGTKHLKNLESLCVSEIGQWHTFLVNTLIPSKIVTEGMGRLREGVKGFLNITMSSILHEVYFTYHKIQPLYMSNSMIFFSVILYFVTIATIQF